MDGYDGGAYAYVGAVEAEVGGNSPLAPSPALVPALVVARQMEQTQAPALAPSPRATDVETHCLVAVEGPHRVPDRVLTNGMCPSWKAQAGVFLEFGAAQVVAANVGEGTDADAADAGPGSGACLVGPVLLPGRGGSSHQTCGNEG